MPDELLDGDGHSMSKSVPRYIGGIVMCVAQQVQGSRYVSRSSRRAVWNTAVRLRPVQVCVR